MDKKPKKLTAAAAKQRLLLILEHGRIAYTEHCANVRMPQRNVTPLDVEFLFEDGTVTDNTKWSDDYQNWQYRIEGTDIEGEELKVVTIIIEEYLMARVITVF
ncbi:MAG TPA: DUF4258 domain-containing protein [Blastocatellia bacterium]|nr:DUF4258 domain-containing protein [Blastocatellia bacterium]